MPLPYSRIALTARSDFEKKEEMLNDIAEIVIESGASLAVDAERCDCPSLKKYERYANLRGFDLIIVVGGDGTILRTVKEMEEFSAVLLTVNTGTIGFLSELSADECLAEIPKFLAGTGHVEEREMLACTVMRNGKEIISEHALNEIVVSQGAIARLIQLKTTINDVPFTTFRADGIIISTPTGSTAYNLAAGGTILHPSSAEIIITPINPHTLTQKPLGIPSRSHITVEVLHRESSHEDVRISLTIDGQTHHEIARGDRVEITTHKERIRFLRREHDSFYETLREKLGWGE